MNKVRRFASTHKKLLNILIGLSLLLLGLLTAAYLYVGSYGKYIIAKDAAANKQMRIGIVFGAGIAPNGKPYEELVGRLDGAAELLNQGIVDKLLLSGDNRFYNYNEPQAMQDYLTQKGIPSDALQQDNAGRSTYETCERAHKVFGLNQAILITSSSHLPRALYTCRKFGIESYGVAYGKDANNALRREFLARNKAIFNAYIIGEKTILGDHISL